MSKIEGVLFWLSMFVYFSSFLLYLTDAVFKKEKLGRRAWSVFLLGFIFQTLTIAWRWYISGRIPVMVSYEHYQLGAWFIGISTIIGGLVYPRMRVLSMVSAAVML